MVALTDATGAITTRYAYDPFGVTTAIGATSTNASQFTGRENDGALYYYRARYYDPDLGRFISEDPLGFGAGDPNLYAYVGNHPTDARDPSGNCPMCVICGFGALIGAGSTIAQAPAEYQLWGRKTTIGDVLQSAAIGCATFGVAELAGPFVGTILRGAGEGAGVADRVVIGKMADITADGALGSGEKTLLDQLPRLSGADAQWAQNERVLLKEMQSGNPIRDATVDAEGNLLDNTGFLSKERAVLVREGWTYDAATRLWSPGG